MWYKGKEVKPLSSWRINSYTPGTRDLSTFYEYWHRDRDGIIVDSDEIEPILTKRVYTLKPGSTLLFDVYSINNLKIEKQDGSNTFSDFINQKVKEKFEKKTRNISTLPNFKIIPILEYTEGLESFKITVDNEIAIPPLTVVKNTIDGVDNISLSTLEEISNHICHQRIAKWETVLPFRKEG